MPDRSLPRHDLPRDPRVVAIAAMLSWQEGTSEFIDDALALTWSQTVDAGTAPGDPRDAGLSRELALGGVRFGLLYDHLADRYLKPGAQSPLLRAALRIGSHQLFALDRIPPHAAVGETVQALEALGGVRLKGVANAVLRRLSELRQQERDGDGPLGRLRPAAQPSDLAIRHSLPPLLITHLREAIAEDPERLLAALNVVPPLCTRTRPRLPAPRGRSILRQDGSWTWWEDPQEAIDVAVRDGQCVVQDYAQGQVLTLARARPGERVLDLCSAPGGKSLGLIDAGCHVISADVSFAKLAGLRELPRRLVQDGARPALAAAFDLVLVDAPCSNSGVLARRPEARWRYDAATLERLGRLQRRLLTTAATLVAPGGRLVYATCSLSPRENQAVAQALPGWRILAEKVSWPNAWASGGYAALLVRSPS